jgi:uncharacterized secreted protein with C-terminal beta-propeller domain
MRSLSKLALGGGAVSTVAAGALVAGGIFATTATLVVTDPLAPKASADSLRRFEDCGSLLRWYVDHGVREVGPYGWNGPIMYAMDDVVSPLAAEPMPATGSASAASGTEARANSDTGTNTQEADVDEPDVAKTDGRRVVRIVDERVVVVSDVTGAEPRELGRISLPIDVYGAELLLAGDHVLVSQPGTWGVAPGGPAPIPMPMEDGAGSTPESRTGSRMLAPATGTRIIDVDIAGPTHPRIVHDDTYSGTEVSMRRYGDVVRLVTSTPRPELRWATPGTGRWKRSSEDAALRHNRALVRATSIDDWLPTVVDNLGSTSPTPLVECGDVYHPASWSGDGTTAVTTYDVAAPAGRRSVAVTSDGQVVYSSADRLYVASTRVDESRMSWPMSGGPDGSVSSSEMMPIRPPQVNTQLHAFALDGLDTEYVGSGHVAGTVRDRWSLDEQAGRLRVAWTRSDKAGTQNGITVLAERGGALVPTGTIDRLGVDENIQSVRWFDDFAVLVTFRQMDPLYTIDLSDADHPRELGRLKIPGYSGYLHPIGGDLLLGLGVDATEQGQSLGSQVAVFDIGDLSDPRRLSHQGLGRESSLPAIDDPHGFTWLPDRRTALTTVSSWTNGRNRLVALLVTDGGGLQARDLATDVGWNARTLPLDDGRVALVDENGLRVLEVG